MFLVSVPVGDAFILIFAIVSLNFEDLYLNNKMDNEKLIEFVRKYPELYMSTNK